MNQATGIEASVCADITARQALGLAKYGMSLADNQADLKSRLTHAYLECLDQALYLKWAIVELDNQGDRPSHREVP
jgi:nicotinamidase-related amidase